MARPLEDFYGWRTSKVSRYCDGCGSPFWPGERIYIGSRNDWWCAACGLKHFGPDPGGR